MSIYHPNPNTLYKSTTYGQKGGEGPTRGKKATRYVGYAPDGTKFEKRSFFLTKECAYMGIYQHEGVWYASGITDLAVEIDGDLVPVYNGNAAKGQLAVTAYRMSEYP